MKDSYGGSRASAGDDPLVDMEQISRCSNTKETQSFTKSFVALRVFFVIFVVWIFFQSNL